MKFLLPVFADGYAMGIEWAFVDITTERATRIVERAKTITKAQTKDHQLSTMFYTDQNVLYLGGNVLALDFEKNVLNRLRKNQVTKIQGKSSFDSPDYEVRMICNEYVDHVTDRSMVIATYKSVWWTATLKQEGIRLTTASLGFSTVKKILERERWQCLDPNCPDAKDAPYHDHAGPQRQKTSK